MPDAVLRQWILCWDQVCFWLESWNGSEKTCSTSNGHRRWYIGCTKVDVVLVFMGLSMSILLMNILIGVLAESYNRGNLDCKGMKMRALSTDWLNIFNKHGTLLYMKCKACGMLFALSSHKKYWVDSGWCSGCNCEAGSIGSGSSSWRGQGLCCIILQQLEAGGRYAAGETEKWKA